VATNFLRDAVIGCAFNYDTRDILPFLKSLEEAQFKGDLILFINDYSKIEVPSYSYNTILLNPDEEFRVYIAKHKRYLKKLEKYKLENLQKLIVFQYAKRRIGKKKSLPGWCIAYFYTFYNLMTSRFFLYYFFLKERSYDAILFTDVSDVIFQGYPLLSTYKSGIHAFSENISYTISQEECTRDWIKEGFGDEVLNIIANQPVYCAGTIISAGKITFTFLRDLISLMIDFDISPTTEGIDQGFFNYMISYLKKPYFFLIQNGGHVFTVGLQRVEDIVCSNSKLFLKGKEEKAPCIIHQYNRHPSLVRFINTTYSDSKIVKH
jgi:hypothetical protein